MGSLTPIERLYKVHLTRCLGEALSVHNSRETSIPLLVFKVF